MKQLFYVALEHFRINRFLSPRVTVLLTVGELQPAFLAHFRFLDRPRLSPGKVHNGEQGNLMPKRQRQKSQNLPNLPR